MDHTDSEDPVLIWGAETMINFYTKRTSPTRYVYQYGLVAPGYTTEEKVVEFLDDLLKTQPVVLVDSNREDIPFFKFAVTSELIEQKTSEVLSLYGETSEIDGWTVYQLAGSTP